MCYVGLLHSLDQPQGHDQANDDALVVAAQSGSEPAFKELCRRNAGHLFRSILRVTKDHADAEDALQDSLIRAFVHIRQFDRRSSFSTWLTRIGINSALMILRKKRKICEISIDLVNSDENMKGQWDFVDIAANPEEHCLLSDMRRKMDHAIYGLPLNLRVVAELRLVKDLSLYDIATTLNISVPATKSRLRRAKRRIAGTLHGNMFPDTQQVGLRPAEYLAKPIDLGALSLD
jgi:RNA polymerase sigma-70 factor, ECF subfamily